MNQLKNSSMRKTAAFRRWLLIAIILLSACTTKVHIYQEFSNLPEPLPSSEGQLIYEESKCDFCHGIQGDGDGFLAEGLNPKPTDFTSTQLHDPLAVKRWEKAIRHGVKGTSMPSYPDFSRNQIRDLLNYLQSFTKMHS